MTHREMINIAIQDLNIQLDRYKDGILLSHEQRMVDLYRFKVKSLEYTIDILNKSLEEVNNSDVQLVTDEPNK